MRVPPRFPTGLSIAPWGVFAGLALLAVLSYGLLHWVESALREPVSPEEQEPVLIIEQFQATRFNASGHREWVIEAPRMMQLSGVQGTYIEHPVLNGYQPDGQTLQWWIEAHQGWISADRCVVHLEAIRGVYEPNPL